MAELLLQDLEPLSLARPPQDFGYDFLVVFTNSKGGINTFGVEVKSTDRPVSSSFVIDRQTYNRLAHSTIPGLLLVADVKQRNLFYGFPKPVDARLTESKSVHLPITKIDEKTRKELRKRLIASNGERVSA